MARRKRRQPPAERYGKGTAEWVGRGDRGCWVARVSVPGQKSRPRIKLSTPEGRLLDDHEGDRALAVQLAEGVSELVRAEAFQKENERKSARLTVKQFGELWTSGELYDRHGQVRGLKPKKTADDDATRLKAHVYPYIGTRAVADITEQDIERCMAEAARRAEKKLGKPWRQATRFQLYQALRRLFELAVKPGRLRADNPVSRDLRPSKDKPKLYSFLYPTELLALLAAPAEKVPLPRRVHYALAVYTGLRKGSLRSLTWAAVDFKHGTLTVLDTKNGVPQIFELSADVVAVLQAWHELKGQPAKMEPVIRSRDLDCPKDREASTLRDDLKAAGVTREILFSDADNVEPLRFHDMRATFVTWARRQGKGKGWISDRTGHLTEEMMDRYDRGARLLADLRYEPFPNVSRAIPELSSVLSNVTRIDEFRQRAPA
jgi:integrase